MELLPAIDLREGKCVRLIQGNYEQQIDYHDDPAAQAKHFQEQGAKWLHVVDLDGARYGKHYNLDVLKEIRAQTQLNIEIGGGIRSEASVKILLDIGINRVIVGTKALEEPQWFIKMVDKYPQKIVLGLDARNGIFLKQGWEESSDLGAPDIFTHVLDKIKTDKDLAAIVYTDISQDGMLTGPNLEETRVFVQKCQSRFPVIASGGVGSLEDIRQLAKLPIAGIIVGRALYEGKFTLEEALKVVAEG